MSPRTSERKLAALLLALLTSCADRPGGTGSPGPAGDPGVLPSAPGALPAGPASGLDLEALVEPDARDAALAARAGLRRFLDAIPADQAQGFGFDDHAELQRAELAAPYRVWTSDDGASGVVATGEWRFPVIVDGAPRALLTVSQVDGAHRAVDLGAATLSRELGALERARGVAPGARRVLLRLPALRADLAAFPAAGARVDESLFEPLASTRAVAGGPRAAVAAAKLLPWVRERLDAKPSTR